MDKIELNEDVSMIAANLYANIVDAGHIDVHAASVTWLDKTGDRLTMSLRKTDVKA